MIRFRPATADDLGAIKLRPQDLEEVLAASPDSTPEEVLRASVGLSDIEASVGVDEETGEVVCVYGCATGPDCLVPWMLSAASVSKHRVAIFREAERFIERCLEAAEMRPLINYIYKHNSPARAFVRRLGFTILPAPGNGDFEAFFLCANPYQ